MEMLDTTNERELASLTRLSLSQVRRCKVLLTYPERIQQMMLAPPSERLKQIFSSTFTGLEALLWKKNFCLGFVEGMKMY